MPKGSMSLLRGGVRALPPYKSWFSFRFQTFSRNCFKFKEKLLAMKHEKKKISDKITGSACSLYSGHTREKNPMFGKPKP